MFIGRSAQLRTLVAELELAGQGTARVVHLVGDAGIGKTALATQAAAVARGNGFTVAWGRAWNDAAAPPFWLWSQVLDAAGRPMPDLPTSARPEPGARTALLRTFLASVGEAASHPLMVVLDDLHHADPGSLMLTSALLHSLPGRPLLVLSTWRPDDGRLGDTDLPGLSLRLPGLDITEVTELAEAYQPGDGVDVAGLTRATGGNAFMVVEALRTGSDDALRSRTRSRLAGLDTDARRLVATTAVVGDLPIPGVVARVAGLPPERFTAAHAGASMSGLLIDGPGFRHAVVRECCYDALHEEERAALHVATADALDPDGLGGRHVEAVAYHRRAALPYGDPAAAVTATCTAVQAALRLPATEDAVAQCEAGLAAIVPYGAEATAWRAHLLMLRGEAEALAGSGTTARDTVGLAIELAAAADDATLVGEATLRMPRTGTFYTPDPELERLLSAALDRVGDSAPALRIRLLARLAYDVAMGEHDSPGAGVTARGRPLAEQVVTEARAFGDPALLGETLSARLFAFWEPETLDERLTVGPEITRLGKQTDDLPRLLDGLLWTFVAHLEHGDADRAESVLTEFGYQADRSGRPEQLLYARSRAATLHALRGSYAESERLAAQAAEFAVAAGAADADALRIAQLAPFAWARGGYIAEQLLDTCRDVRVFAHPLMAVVAPIYAGQAAAARPSVRAFRHQLDRVPGPSRLYAYHLVAEAAHALDEPDLARDLYARLLPYGDRCAVSAGGAAANGAVSRALGLCAMTTGDLDEAERWLRHAIDRNRAFGAVPYVAASQVDLAEARVRRGLPVEDLLIRAAATAYDLGMDRLTGRIATIRALGSPPRPTDDVTAVAQAAAVLGPGADPQLVAAVCDLPVDRFAAALPQVPVAERPQLAPAERSTIHLRAAEAMQRLGMHRRHRDLLAAHRISALPLGDPHAAVAATLDATRAAVRELRPADAILPCEQALEAIAAYGDRARRWRAELLIVLGAAQLETGRLAAARQSLAEAADLADAVGEPGIAIDAVLRIPIHARYEPADDRLETALRERLPSAEPAHRVRILARLAADILAETVDAAEEQAAMIATAVREARRLGDGPLLAQTLLSWLRVMLGSHDVDTRLATGAEVVDLSRRHDLPVTEMEGRLHLFTLLLEAGRAEQAAVEQHRHDDLAIRTRHPLHLMYARLTKGTLAALRGEFDTAQRLAAEAYEHGSTHTPDATTVLLQQRFAVAWTRKRFDDGVLTDLPAQDLWLYPLLPVAQLMDQGRIDEARRQLGTVLGVLDRTPPSARPFAYAVVGELAHLLDDADTAAEVYRRLQPYADRFVVNAPGYACAGSAARVLGLCASTTGDVDGATALLRTAVVKNRAGGAMPFVAAGMAELAEVLHQRGLPRDHAEIRTLRAESNALADRLGMARLGPHRGAVPETPRLVRQGELWRLEFRQRHAMLRHSKGLEQLATLLANPGTEITAVQLAGGVDCADRPPVLDETAKRAYRRRLTELDDRLDRADKQGNRAVAVRAERERNALVKEITRANGLNGRTRAFSDDAERARINVTRTLRQAIDQITAADAEAGLHLRTTVRTGTRCSYTPGSSGQANHDGAITRPASPAGDARGHSISDVP